MILRPKRGLEISEFVDHVTHFVVQSLDFFFDSMSGFLVGLNLTFNERFEYAKDGALRLVRNRLFVAIAFLEFVILFGVWKLLVFLFLLQLDRIIISST